MSLTPAVYLLFISALACLYWSMPSTLVTARASVVILGSAVGIMLLSPLALLVAISVSIVTSVVSGRLARRPSLLVAGISVAAVISILALSRSVPWFPGSLTWLDLTGSAFFALKAVAIISDAHRFSRTTRPLDALFLILFFPTYEAGPIEGPSQLNRTACAVPFDPGTLVDGTGRILVGIAKQAFLGGVILSGLAERLSPWDGGASSIGIGGVLLWILLKWSQIYLMFSGYSDVAIGSAKLFGINVRENFNFPFLAHNLQDFWQRWHRSLIDFMSSYVYQPFVRWTGWRYRGIFLLFLLTGLWHAFTPQYLLWGVLHGSAMAGLARWRRSDIGRKLKAWVSAEPMRAVPAGIITRVLTLFFIAWASAIGGSETWARAVSVFSLGAYQ